MARYFDGKVNPNSPQLTEADRYQVLGLKDAEPNLGLPDEDGYLLVSDVFGNRSWVPSEVGPLFPFIPENIINAKGDIIIGLSPNTPSILSVAPDGCVLLADSTAYLGVKWINFPELGVPLSAFTGKGNMVVALSSGVIGELTIGTDGQILIVDSGESLGLRWGDLSDIGIPKALIESKGDLIVGATNDDPQILSLGNEGEVLVVDSSQPLGVKWGVASGSGIPETIIQDKGDLIVGAANDDPQILSLGNEGEVLVVDSSQPLGVKWAPQSSTPSTIQTLLFETTSLAPGASQDFELDFGQLYHLMTVEVTTAPDDLWIRAYTSYEGRAADTRIVPGPPFPSPNTGFALEVVTSPLEPSVNLLPVLTVYGGCGTFFRVTNQSLTTQTFGISFNYYQIVEPAPFCCPTYPLLPVTFPPYSCDTNVNTSGVTDFTSGWESCYITSFPCVDSSSVTDFSYAWNECGYLTSFPRLNTSQGTNFTYSWGYCYALTSFPILDFSSGDNFTYSWAYSGLTSFPPVDLSTGSIFYGTWCGCYYLTSFPSLDLSNGLDFTYAWYYCTSLTSFPLINVNQGTNFYEAWRNCTSLTSFSPIDFSSGTNFDSAWYNCESLTSFPLINVSQGTDFSYAWYNCNNLTSFPLLNVSQGTDFSDAWKSCTSLTSFSPIDFSSGTNFDGAWYNCESLTSFPLINVSQGTDFSYAWNNCTSLTSFPLLDVSQGTDFSGAWGGCTSLTSFPALDVSQGFNFSSAWYNCTSLTSFPLLDVSSGNSFYSTWGYCESLTSFPLLNVSQGTDFSYAWYNCTGLTSFPLLNFNQGTNFSYAWQNCTGLTSFPLLNVSSGIGFSGAWSNCGSLTAFPLLDVSSGLLFNLTWQNCTSLTSFPAGMFDSCLATNFSSAWNNCALDQTSVDNILVSLDAAGRSNGFVSLDGGTSSAPGAAGLAAKASLIGKGWTVFNN